MILRGFLLDLKLFYMKQLHHHIAFCENWQFQCKSKRQYECYLIQGLFRNLLSLHRTYLLQFLLLLYLRVDFYN